METHAATPVVEEVRKDAIDLAGEPTRKLLALDGADSPPDGVDAYSD
jgi:hypothetical protein